MKNETVALLDKVYGGVFTLTWSVTLFFHRNKRKRLHHNIAQFNNNNSNFISLNVIVSGWLTLQIAKKKLIEAEQANKNTPIKRQ